jgi:hypothetical protein
MSLRFEGFRAVAFFVVLRHNLIAEDGCHAESDYL